MEVTNNKNLDSLIFNEPTTYATIVLAIKRWRVRQFLWRKRKLFG
jgi:hypothetical protein